MGAGKPVETDERQEVLQQLEEWLEGPVVVLGFVWLVLLVVELTWGVNPLLSALTYAIWALFLVDFTVRLILAPDRLDYLRHNWLTVLSLIVPAFRIFRLVRALRVLRAARAVRGLQIVRVVGSVNRSMRALQRSLSRRGLGYAAVLTLLVLLVSAAGMYWFERGQSSGFTSFGESLWWAAMTMTTMGADYSPVTVEGRLLALMLAVYAFAE